jgi:acyl transferase domain-containing protein
MIAAGLSFEKAVSLCSSAQFVGRLYVAAHNAPQSTTLSGDEDAVQEAEFDLKQDGTFARMLKVDTAYHSPHMQPCARAYLDSLRRCKIEYTTVRQSCSWISSVHGFEMDSSSDPVSDQYWLDNLVNPVLFCEAVCQAHADHGPFTSILEVGPHPALKGPTTQTLQHFAQVAVPYHGTLSRGTDDVLSFLESLGLLWTNSPSLSIDFFSFAEAMGNGVSETPQILKGLPSYAWDHTQSFWRESRLSKKYRSRHESPHELLGVRIDASNSEFRWRNIIRLKEVLWLRGHEFQGGALFPAAGYCAMALEASRAIWEGRSVEILELRDVQIMKAVDLEEDVGALLPRSIVALVMSMALVQCRQSSQERFRFRLGPSCLTYFLLDLRAVPF